MDEIEKAEWLAFDRLVWDDDPLALTDEQIKGLTNDLERAFRPVYNKWILVREQFTIAMRKQVVEETFAGMNINYQFNDAVLATIKRRAVEALNKAISSEINDRNCSKKEFVSYFAVLFSIQIKGFNWPKGSRGEFKSRFQRNGEK